MDEGPAPRTVELTLEGAIELAILLQKSGRLTEAARVFGQVLERAPDHPRALHFAGVLAHQQGRSDEAITLIERSLDLEPADADACSNLGLVRQAAGHLDEAVEAYRRAMAIAPDHANAHSNLGVLLRVTGHPVDAESAYRRAIALDPGHVDAHTNLGILLNSLNRTEEAAACFSKAITLRPSHRDARRLLALAHCTLGEFDDARRIFVGWLAEEPDDPIARHMLAACTGHEVPGRASDDFVQQTFDGFAATFESRLARLSYRAPTLVAAVLDRTGLVRVPQYEVIDAGCGTGLCAAWLAPFARRLTGVDLSAGMLARAGEKQIYDVLVQAELTEFLRGRVQDVDLIVSADTLVYFGDLTAVADAAAGALRPGGQLIFTLERLADAAAHDYRLEWHGRYSHSREYVGTVLARAGLTATIEEADLRMEAGKAVAGLVVHGVRDR
jgi:predicted TPR repeat methyltransferase